MLSWHSNISPSNFSIVQVHMLILREVTFKDKTSKTTKLMLLDSLLQEAEATLPDPCVADREVGRPRL